MRNTLLSFGEPAPWFTAAATANPTFHFESLGGLSIALCFFGSAAQPTSRRVLDDFVAAGEVFDAQRACFFGVSTDPDDTTRVVQQPPGIQCFWDFDFNASQLYGAGEGAGKPYHPHTLVLDERLRVFACFPIEGDGSGHARQVLAALAELPPAPGPAKAAVQAPILIVPRVFEPKFCRELIRYYDQLGGRDSGFMREVNGRTVEVFDHDFKRRSDRTVEDEPLRRACMVRIHDRLVPEIHKAYQFKATRIERYMVSCYEADTAGHFHPHRDNTTKGTAHRRFAVSLNLNTGEYDGGELRFPEFGWQTYTAPAGGAVVFSCSLLHEATAITQGRRYVFLPFLYDDAAARIREENLKFLGANPSGASH